VHVNSIRAGAGLALLALAGCGESAPPPPAATALSIDDFRRELVNMPLCGKPTTGPVAGKTMCTVHASDGTATLAGPGLVARGVWDTDGRSVCRRDVTEAVTQRRCVTYEKLSDGRYRNSDGVEFCLGPCPDSPK
jgi:hypothetical protein